jgi:sugar lactone lactonase YvrE
MYLIRSATVCWSLFIDSSNQVYCSEKDRHRVVKISSQQANSVVSIIAGTGCYGPGHHELHDPLGIFIASNQDLYVSDCWNHRVQRFRPGEVNGTTAAGNGVSGNLFLHCPASVILDADEYLFIADHHHHRVVGSGPFGFRCIVGCSEVKGIQANELSQPTIISFDSMGNLYVLDSSNSRLQRFQLINSTPSGKHHHLYLAHCD